jgi:hypothetical protein
MEQSSKEFEREMSFKKEQWQGEQQHYEQEKKERELRIKKERAREEEEYRYMVLTERKKEQDAYEEHRNRVERELQEKKSVFEKECFKREAAIKEKEEEFALFKTRVSQFPQELESAVKNVEKATKEAIDRDYNHKMQLIAKDTESEKKLTQQIIASLQDKIKEQETLMRQLSQRVDTAGQQVQSIALKALESAGARLVVEENKKSS